MRQSSIRTSLGLVTVAAVFTAVASQQEYDVVIVGAGWAGLRAVDTLLSRGVDSVLVLEAYHKVGGRARSKNADGTENNPDLDDSTVPYDLGVEWNYDSGINEQQDVLWEEGLIPGRVWEDQEYMAVWPTWPGKATYYKQAADGTATKLNDGEGLMRDLWAPFLEFRDDNLDGLEGQSYGEAIEQYTEEKGITNKDELQFLNLIRDAKHLEYGTDGYDMDIDQIEFTDPSFHVETNYMGTPGLGWGNIAAKYGAKFSDNIKTKAKVTEINSEDDDDFAIVTFEKNGSSRTVKARTVLVTVSLGVLKAGNIKFVPSLPNDKQKAIDDTGFGVINKCIMSWSDEADKVWPDENEEDMWFLMATPDDETTGQWTTFSNPSRFKGVPSLTAWIGGVDAIEAEEMSDNDVFRHVMKNLKAMFPTISSPSNAIITRWGKEENVLGAYSFPSPGQNYYGDMAKIRRTEGSVYFAGEGTSSNGWASTFGAWESGEKAAKEMVRRMQAGEEDSSISTEEEETISSADENSSADEVSDADEAPQVAAAQPDSSGISLHQSQRIFLGLLVGLWAMLGPN